MLQRAATRAALALRRSRGAFASIAVVQVGALVAGAVLAHAGVPAVVAHRDAIVEGAQGSATAEAFRDDERARAVLLDFGANYLVGGIATGASGISVLPPYLLGAYRGWIGGIVSIGPDHGSRLREPLAAAYYLSVVGLHTVGFVLCSAGGVRVGLAWVPRRAPDGRTSLRRIPRSAWMDMLVVWAMAGPFFLAGSAVEFGLAP